VPIDKENRMGRGFRDFDGHLQADGGQSANDLRASASGQEQMIKPEFEREPSF
jgi:hypothetical protein